MHIDRERVEERVRRELDERVAPLVEREQRPVAITAGPTLDQQAPFTAGDEWGAPWATTWFVLRGEVPEAWSSRRVEVVCDLGFDPDQAGFQCEGLVVDDRNRPVQGIHPRRTNFRLDGESGPFELRIEAASNPSFPPFRPSELGLLETSHDRPIYRFRRAALVLIDEEAESLLFDLRAVNELMLALHLDDPRRPRMLRALTDALDASADAAAARSAVAPILSEGSGSVAHRIIATGHAHIDTAWLWPMGETKRKCTRTFASAVRLMDDDPEYRFVCSQAQQYAWIEESHPDLFAKIMQKTGDGQWVPVGGMWVEPDMNLPSGESLVRQIVFGQRYFFERFGMRCTEVWVPDVFGYPVSMPQLFAAGGMRRFVTQKLSWNTTNRFPHHTFWWEGLDGTRVLTHFPPVDTYNAEVSGAEVVESSRRFLDSAWSEWSLMPFGHGDGGGGPTREMLARAHRFANAAGAPAVTIGTPTEFFEHVEREADEGAPVPVWRGELYFETHRGTLTSQLRTKVGNRRCERTLREVELWSATAGRPADVDDLWRDVLTQQFHDIVPGSSIAWVHHDAESTHTRVLAELEKRLSDIFQDISPPSPHVANSSSVDRDEVIEVVGEPLGDGQGCQPTSDGRYAVRVEVPAHGMAELNPLAASDHVIVDERSMSNHYLSVNWDAGGNLTSVIDRRRTRELLPAGKAGAVLEVGPDHPVRYDAWDLETWTPGVAAAIDSATSIEIIDSGPLLGRVRVCRTFGPSRAVVSYTIRADSARLDIGVDLDWQHREHLLSMSFPLDVRSDTAACDIQFGHVRRPTHASTSWDWAKSEVCAHRFVDLAEPDFGVAVLNDGRYGHGLFDGRVRVSLARAASYPDPDADRGRHSVRLALFPHGAGLQEVVAEAERFNMPLRIVTGSAPAVPAPLVELTGDGVEIDAIKPADDDPGAVIVRLHEAVGNRSRVAVKCARGISAASRCNLLEEPHDVVEVRDGVCSLTIMPFEIITLRLASR